jgi:hypothetical protein
MTRPNNSDPSKEQTVDPEITGRNPNGTFAEGQTGNPNGKPQGSKGRARRILHELFAANDFEKIKTLGLALYSAALKGDTQAAKIIIEYECGKPDQSIELTGALAFDFSGVSLEDIEAALERAKAAAP